jgi:hypothetical protein
MSLTHEPAYLYISFTHCFKYLLMVAHIVTLKARVTDLSFSVLSNQNKMVDDLQARNAATLFEESWESRLTLGPISFIAESSALWSTQRKSIAMSSPLKITFQPVMFNQGRCSPRPSFALIRRQAFCFSQQLVSDISTIRWTQSSLVCGLTGITRKNLRPTAFTYVCTEHVCHPSIPGLLEVSCKVGRHHWTWSIYG